MNSLLTEYQAKAKKIVTLLQDDLTGVKTGRAKPNMVEHIKVEVYGGSWMEVRELASISAPDAQTILISPWDKTILKDLERGLRQHETKINPVIDGQVIRIHIPALTEETRKDMVKLVHQKLESHRAMVRSERVTFKKKIEEMKNTRGVSEDDIERDLEALQKMTDESMRELDAAGKNKENEIMTV